MKMTYSELYKVYFGIVSLKDVSMNPMVNVALLRNKKVILAELETFEEGSEKITEEFEVQRLECNEKLKGKNTPEERNKVLEKYENLMDEIGRVEKVNGEAREQEIEIPLTKLDPSIMPEITLSQMESLTPVLEV